MKLRPYQQKAVDAFIEWMVDGKDRPLIVLPTGTGKSVVAAEICRDVKMHAPHRRIVVATHVKELVRQNYEKFMAVYSNAYAGIVSSGLKRKEYHKDIVFTGIQSAYKNAIKFGHIDLLLIDEAHCIPPKGMGMWNRFITDLKSINPNMRVGGMTATPFRMTTGTRIGGSHPQFNGVCYEYKILDAIKQGYLSEIVSAPVETTLSTEGVGKRGGEFIQSELEKAVDVDETTQKCCDEIISLGQGRKTWLIFASGNSHAQHIHEYLQSKGLHGYCITTDDQSMRDQAVQELTDGKCRYIVNNMIFTTGFDCPRLDLIACLRPTQSPGLWVQICGRGTRLHPGKENCLLLDFGRNIDRHGPIDEISGSEWFESKEKGDAPIKNCPECFELVHAAAMICPNCQYKFPARDLNIAQTASRGAILSSQQTEPFDVEVLDMKVTRNKGKNGKPDSLRIKYITLVGDASDFLFYDHPAQSYPYQETVKKFGHLSSVEDALKVKWNKPKTIKIKKNKKYFDIIERYY